MNNITEKTAVLLKSWIRAKAACEEARRELLAEEIEELRTGNELGESLVPADFPTLKEFNILIASGILQVSRYGNPHKYFIRWLKEPDTEDRNETGY